jgi:hypothetical protein
VAQPLNCVSYSAYYGSRRPLIGDYETATNRDTYGQSAGKSAWDNSETNISYIRLETEILTYIWFQLIAQ